MIIDPKGEVYRATAERRRALGRIVRCLDPMNLVRRIRPLEPACRRLIRKHRLSPARCAGTVAAGDFRRECVFSEPGGRRDRRGISRRALRWASDAPCRFGSPVDRPTGWPKLFCRIEGTDRPADARASEDGRENPRSGACRRPSNHSSGATISGCKTSRRKARSRLPTLQGRYRSVHQRADGRSGDPRAVPEMAADRSVCRYPAQSCSRAADHRYR